MLRRDEADDNDWVQEQIRKGVGGGQAPGIAQYPTADQFAQHATNGPILTSKAAASEAARSGNAAMAALSQTLERLKVQDVVSALISVSKSVVMC